MSHGQNSFQIYVYDYICYPPQNLGFSVLNGPCIIYSIFDLLNHKLCKLNVLHGGGAKEH